MNRLTLAALATACAPAVALAQQPLDIPRHKCEPKPRLPGERMMQEPNVRKNFQRDLDTYKNCMKAYADERATAAKAHTDAGNAAISEYNYAMKALQDAQAAAR